MPERPGEFSPAVLGAHRWWDRRMGLWNNLRFGFLLPALCLVRGHRFDWFDVVENGGRTVVSRFGMCSTCARTAERAALSARSEDPS